MPGRTPRPERDAAGHVACRGLRTDGWPERAGGCEAWLYGVDLWNAGFPWEAHEAWEAVWRAHRERAPAEAELLRGLIQCTAAVVRRGMDAERGWRAVAERGLARLDAVAGGADARLGVDARDLAARFRAWVAGPGGPPPVIRPATPGR